MNQRVILLLALGVTAGCARHTGIVPQEQPKAFGTALVLVSGEKQAAGVGAQLDQPLIVQVNNAQGAGVAGALVRLAGSPGVIVTPAQGLTGSDGQLSVLVSLGGAGGHYQLLASTPTASGAAVAIHVDEIALGYQEMLGAKVSEIHCIRCHDSESTAARVSNLDNLTAKPHLFTDGAFLNKMSDADLSAIISHGGIGLNKSPEMPPYENTLSKPEIAALVAYLRAMADPPYRAQGVFYASN